MNRAAVVIVSILALAGAALFLSASLDIVVLLGQNIPQEDLATDYIIGVTWALFLGLSIVFWPIAGRDKKPLMTAWALKCLVTLGFMLIYENHYPIDAFGYYQGSKDAFFQIDSFRIGDGTANIARLAWLLGRVTPDSYHMMKVTFSLVGLIALYLIYRGGAIFTGKEDKRVFYVLMLFPSHIFWSSTLGKDPVILLGIGIYIYGVAGWYRTNNLRHLAIIALGIFETSFIRVWIAVILLAPLSVFFMARMRGILWRLAFIALVIAGFSWAHQRFNERFNIETTEDLVKTADITSRSWAFGGSAQTNAGPMENLSDMALFLPLGITSALLRPLPGEVLNMFGFLAGMENLAFICILVLAGVRTRWQDLLEPMVLWAIALLLFWSTTYSFASYQNLGTAARFKLQIMPVFLGLIMYLSRRRTPSAPMPTARG